ncbi:MAG: CBS domain-containing protein, partial [Phaeodactylibacter sp.]|nr:CBS domain-containing protein [Phaeodactylibacter sp.]
MGTKAKKLYTDREHLNQFIHALIHDIKALEMMLREGMVESGVQRIGAEQELCLLDASWRPAPWNLDVLDKLREPHFTTEHSRYNLEINLDPLEFRGDCLSRMA